MAPLHWSVDEKSVMVTGDLWSVEVTAEWSSADVIVSSSDVIVLGNVNNLPCDTISHNLLAITQ